MKRVIKGFVVVFFLALLVFAGLKGIRYIQKNRPNKNKIDLAKIYKAEGDQASIIYENDMMEEVAFVVDGKIYLDIEFAKSYLDDKIFFDYNELLFSYTTPDQLIRSFIDQSEYTINGADNIEEYKITVVNAEEDVFVSLDFVEKYSNYKHEYFSNPNRLLIWTLGKEDRLSNVVKEAELRVLPDIKSEIIMDVVEEQLVYVITEGDVDNGVVTDRDTSKWNFVMTQDGFQGYIRKKYLGESQVVKRSDVNYVYDYTSILMEDPVSLVWHQVTNVSANNNIGNLLDGTVGVNVVSPTWFTLKSAEGDISSIASKSYVNTVKGKGVQVWGLITNQFNRNLTRDLLQYTSRRDAFVRNLIDLAIEYDLDGINIDFESFNNTEGEAFTQLIRELSIECRKNQLVLSVDIYVPSAWNLFMDRTAITEVADYLIVMGYDEHWGGGPTSGSVSSIGFFEKGLYDTLELAPANKIIMGLPFYTRLWEEVEDQIVSYNAYGMDRARRILEENAIEPVWDEETGQFYAEYQIGDSVFKIWLEDSSSIEERMKVIKDANIAGFAAWKLGLESKAVWNVIDSYNRK